MEMNLYSMMLLVAEDDEMKKVFKYIRVSVLSIVILLAVLIAIHIITNYKANDNLFIYYDIFDITISSNDELYIVDKEYIHLIKDSKIKSFSNKELRYCTAISVFGDYIITFDNYKDLLLVFYKGELVKEIFIEDKGFAKKIICRDNKAYLFRQDISELPKGYITVIDLQEGSYANIFIDNIFSFDIFDKDVILIASYNKNGTNINIYNKETNSILANKMFDGTVIRDIYIDNERKLLYFITDDIIGYYNLYNINVVIKNEFHRETSLIYFLENGFLLSININDNTIKKSLLEGMFYQ